MEEKMNDKGDYILLYGIVIVIAIFGLFYSFSTKDGEENKFVPSSRDPGQETVVNPIPQPILKTEEVLLAEKKVSVIRDIKLNKDGSWTIAASLKGLSNIPDNVVLNDFHEEIRLGKKANIVSGNVVAKNGYLFPMDDKIPVSTYGPGAESKKLRSISITLLDLNFDLKAKNGQLYELNFVPEVSISEFIFASTEVRSGKYILEFKEEKIRP